MADTTVLAEVPCAPGRRLHFAWGLGAELLLVDIEDSAAASAQPSPSSTTQLSWGFAGPLRRRVITETLPKFIALRNDTSLDQQRLVDYATTIANILDQAANVPTMEDDGEGAVLAAERIVWQLLLVFFVSQGRIVGSIALDMAYWLYTNATLLCGGFTEQHALDEASAMGIPEDNTTYWHAIHRCVALGWIKPAAQLLGLHTAWQRLQLGQSAGDASLAGQLQVLEALLILLRRMPVLVAPGGGVGGAGVGRMVGGGGGDSAADFVQKRTRWLATCRQLLDDQDAWTACRAVSPTTAAGCRTIVTILLGDAPALEASTGSWLELLIAQLLHVHPMARPQGELAALMEQCRQQHSNSGGGGGGGVEDVVGVYLEPLATLLPLAGDADVQGLITALSNMFGDWFMAHTADLLSHASSVAGGVLQRPLVHAGGSQAELYVMDYAATLMPLTTGWQVACRYLEHCSTHGSTAIPALLTTLPVTSPDQQHLPAAVLATARRTGNTAIQHSVHKCVSVDAWLQGRVGEALVEVVGCVDANRMCGVMVSGLVAAIQGALRENNVVPDVLKQQLSLIHPLLSTLRIPSDTIPPSSSPPTQERSSTFLYNLCALVQALDTLHQAYSSDSSNQSNITATAMTVKQCLLTTIQQGVPSQQLASLLLFLVVPLLEIQRGLLSFQETQTLLMAVHGEDVGAPPAVEQSVRMALVRTLARAAAV